MSSPSFDPESLPKTIGECHVALRESNLLVTYLQSMLDKKHLK
ncbi:hypothetical protein KIPB_004177, partial [Kipferlia bialata]|eukprot:g4177.t1